MKRNFLKHIASLTVLVVFCILAFGSDDTDSGTKDGATTNKAVESAKPETQGYTLTARQLYDEYNTNGIAADEKYKGKIVVVTGVIELMGKDFFDEAYVVLAGGGIMGVQCFFDEDEVASLAKLEVGQKVTIKGKVDSMMGYVIVRGCSLR